MKVTITFINGHRGITKDVKSVEGLDDFSIFTMGSEYIELKKDKDKETEYDKLFIHKGDIKSIKIDL